jgi:hypothetical protein
MQGARKEQHRQHPLHEHVGEVNRCEQFVLPIPQRRDAELVEERRKESEQREVLI